MPKPTRRECLAAIAAVPLARLPILPSFFRERVRFSNIEFELTGWKVTQPAPRMALAPSDSAASSDIRLEIDPAEPFAGASDAAIERAWTAALDGQTPSGQRSRDEHETPNGATIALSAAPLSSGGRAVVAVISKNKVTRLVMRAASTASFRTGLALFAALEASIIVLDEVPPAIVAMGANPEDSFNWNGPREFVKGIYDVRCRHWQTEFNELIGKSKGLAGAIAARPMTFAQVQDFLKRMTAHPASKPVFDEAVAAGSAEIPTAFALGAAERLIHGDAPAALVYGAAALETAPKNPAVLFNTAGLLAHNGLANEAIAVLDQLQAVGTLPSVALGVNPRAAIAQTRGYSEMVRGNLPAAETLLKQARALDPFLVEATHTLAVVQNAMGNTAAAKATYKKGIFRRDCGEVCNCSAGPDGPFVQRIEDAEDEFREKTDEKFDCSTGVRPNLAQVDHPGNVQELNSLAEKYSKKAKALVDQAKALIEQSGALARQINRSPVDEPYNAWAEGMSDFIEALEEEEPMLKAIERQNEALRESVGEAVGRAASKHLQRINEIAMSGVSDICPLVMESANRGISQVRPSAQAMDQAIRRYAVAWHRLATALNAHVGDPKWHQVNELIIKSKKIGFDAELMLLVPTQYAHFHWSEKCVPVDDRQGPRDPADSQLPNCPESLKGTGIKATYKLPGPKPITLGVKVTCEKITLEGSLDLIGMPTNPLLSAQAGPFAQVELGGKGKFSIFAGARESATVVGTGETYKQGFYVSGDKNGINDGGFRTTAEYTSGASHSDRGLQISQKNDLLSHEISFVPSPASPTSGPRVPLQAFTGT